MIGHVKEIYQLAMLLRRNHSKLSSSSMYIRMGGQMFVCLSVGM